MLCVRSLASLLVLSLLLLSCREGARNAEVDVEVEDSVTEVADFHERRMQRISVSAAMEEAYAAALDIPLSGEGDRRAVLYAQILLDRAGFSSGQIDGRWGDNTENAIYWLQRAVEAEETGSLDRETMTALLRMAAAPENPDELIIPYTVMAEDLDEAFESIPEEVSEQAELDWLGYESAGEKLGERFHASPSLLADLSGRETLDDVGPGETISVPDVRDHRPRFDASVERLVVSDEGRYLHVIDTSGRIAFHFPATLGAAYSPSPHETMEIRGIAHEPTWHYQPEILPYADDDEDEEIVPPGPNSPVGLVWINLSKEGYGIHGTNAPETIGHTVSAGCVRLTNWDVQFLADLVADGTAVDIKETTARQDQSYGAPR